MQSSLWNVLLLIASCTANQTFSNIEKAFTSYLFVPIVINTVPPLELFVRFSSEQVNLGNKIPAYSASIPPYIYYDAKPDELHTIIMGDADSPSTGAPIDAQHLNALLVNIPGNNLARADYITAYNPVNPYPGSGYHRYFILLFKQTGKIDTTCPELQNLPLNLINFSVKSFASLYGLGEPIAGNFFLSQLVVCEKDEDTSEKCSFS